MAETTGTEIHRKPEQQGVLVTFYDLSHRRFQQRLDVAPCVSWILVQMSSHIGFLFEGRLLVRLSAGSSRRRLRLMQIRPAAFPHDEAGCQN